MNEVYLDYAATSPILPEVQEVITETMAHVYGNPSSAHALGKRARTILEDSRQTIADYLGCKPQNFRFTGSGTESNNIAIRGQLDKYIGKDAKHVVSTNIEHPSVNNTLISYLQHGFDFSFIEPNEHGQILRETFLDEVRENTVLVTAMEINNEIGTHIPTSTFGIGLLGRNKDIHFHVDGVQALGKTHIDLERIDTLSVSAHKIGGPKGIGGLYMSDETTYMPIITGGSQELGLRAGTENIPYIAGFAKAVELLSKQDMDNSAMAHDVIIYELHYLLEQRKSVVINGWGSNIFNFSIPGIPSAHAIDFLSKRGIYVSGGSACNEGEPSPTLTAMKLPKEVIDSCLRVSFTDTTYVEEVRIFVMAIDEMIDYFEIEKG